MSFGGYGAGGGSPFDFDPAGDPFDTGAVSVPDVPAETPHRTPVGEVNTLATLSVVFAFVFAPAGVVLGHVALSQLEVQRLGSR